MSDVEPDNQEKITNFLDFQIQREEESEAFEKQTPSSVGKPKDNHPEGSHNQVKYVNQIRSDVNVKKEGSVLKLAGFLVKTWEDRWFKLRGQHLLYFKNQADSHNQPRQTIGKIFSNVSQIKKILKNKKIKNSEERKY